MGLRNARLNFRQLDYGHLMENVIYNELIRRGYLVDVGAVEVRTKDGRDYLEIDFIVNNLDKKIYIQSAYRIDSEKKNDSETNSLRQINNSFKKVVMRNDIASSFYDENGIYHCKVIEFLLNRTNL